MIRLKSIEERLRMWDAEIDRKLCRMLGLTTTFGPDREGLKRVAERNKRRN